MKIFKLPDFIIFNKQKFYLNGNAYTKKGISPDWEECAIIASNKNYLKKAIIELKGG